jgi:hypothetical protein
MDLKDMDPMEYLVSALKGKFDSELAKAENFDTWKFRDAEGRGVARVLVSKVSKQVRIQTASYTFLLKEGLVSVRQAHDLFNALMA